MERKLTIIVTSMNRLEKTKLCLEAIRNNTHLPFEIIVVDNASTDGTQEWLKEEKEKGNLRCYFNKRNEGRLRAINVGIRYRETDEVVTVENDVLVEDYCIDELIRCLEYSKLDLVGPRVNACFAGQARGRKTDGDWLTYDNIPINEMWKSEYTHIHGGVYAISPRLISNGFLFSDVRAFGYTDVIASFWVKKNGGRLGICNLAFAEHLIGPGATSPEVILPENGKS